MPQESEQVTRIMLERKEKELSQVKAARDKEIAMLKGAIQDAEDKETAMLEGTTQDVTVNPQRQEPQGKKVKERLVIRGFEDPRDRGLKEDCALCQPKGHWRETNEECKTSKGETPEEHLHVQKSDEEIYNWIGMINSSKKESKEVKVKQEKKDDNFEDKKVTTGQKFRNFVINQISYRDNTKEFEYKIQFFLEKKASHIKKRAQGISRITFKHGYCEKVRASNDDKTTLSLFVTPFDQS